METLTLHAERSATGVALQEVREWCVTVVESFIHYIYLACLLFQVTLLHAPRVCGVVGGAVVPLVEEEEEGSGVGLVVVEDLVEEEVSGDVEDVVVGGEGLIDSGLSFSAHFSCMH